MTDKERRNPKLLNGQKVEVYVKKIIEDKKKIKLKLV